VVDEEVYQFLPHCTEKTNEPAAIALWQKVFERMGLKLQVLASGCCGMSGTYGHETRNVATSAIIYQQSWQPIVARHGQGGRLLADGYSCRSQVKRQEGQGLQHPLEVLLARVARQV
jgi:Fe-S oxidoreductase